MEPDKVVPAGYIEIKYDSCGLLGTPRILHFRDYSIEETLKLAQSTDANNLKAIIECLNSMCFEKYDCAGFSMQDLINTVYAIHYSFYSNTIRKNYYIDPDLSEDAGLNNDENIDEVEINLLSLKTKVLNEKCRETFTISNKNGTKSVTFHYPKIHDLLDPMVYTNELFYVVERELSDVIQQMDILSRVQDKEKRKAKYNEIPEEQRKQYEEYANDKAKTYTLSVQASVIEKVDGLELPTLEEKLNRLNDVPNSIWTQYTRVMEEFNYGLDPDVTFHSQYLGKEVTRRFLFQCMDFLPDMGAENLGQYSVHFD